MPHYLFKRAFRLRASKTKDEREQKDRLEKNSKKATHLLCGIKTKGNQLRFISLLYLIALVIKASLMIYGTNQRAQMSDNARLRENRRTKN